MHTIHTSKNFNLKRILSNKLLKTIKKKTAQINKQITQNYHYEKNGTNPQKLNFVK